MYDPLIDARTATEQQHTDSYWHNTTSETCEMPRLKHSKSCDVLIVGAGFTGLSCARYLKREGHFTSLLVDANQPGWGCSGRNAGFILPGSGRLDFSGLAKVYGSYPAEIAVSEYYEALETIEELMDYSTSDCDITNGGYLKIGHSKQAFKQLERGLRNLPKQWQSQYEVVSPQTIKDQYIAEYPNYGGIYRQAGQAINPLKFAINLANKIAYQQENIYSNSPVLEINKSGFGYTVITPDAEIDCHRVVLTSNAYSLKGLLPGITEKQFPVLSSVLVTSPLTDTEASGWKQHLMAMDTRSLKYYFRILPDNRILFGGRGAIAGKDANSKEHQIGLKQAFDQYFPALINLKTEYFWSGWIGVSADNMPHVMESEKYPNLYYANGYCGSGLAFSCQAGKRLAQWICETQYGPEAPMYQADIPSFPFARYRRLGLKLYYDWHRRFS